MDQRAEWIKCIRHTHADQKNTTWCGRPCDGCEWVFVDLDHAVYNAKNGGRLLACSKCIKAALSCLRYGERGFVEY